MGVSELKTAACCGWGVAESNEAASTYIVGNFSVCDQDQESDCCYCEAIVQKSNLQGSLKEEEYAGEY